METIPRSAPFIIVALTLGVLGVEYSQPTPDWGEAFMKIAFIWIGAAAFFLPALWEDFYAKWHRRRHRRHRRQPRKRSSVGTEEA